MTAAALRILDSFDHLEEAEKQLVASAILQRTARLDLPSLSDDELIANAEAVFLELDQQERSA